MKVIKSKINKNSQQYQDNYAKMLELVDKLNFTVVGCLSEAPPTTRRKRQNSKEIVYRLLTRNERYESH